MLVPAPPGRDALAACLLSPLTAMVRICYVLSCLELRLGPQPVDHEGATTAALQALVVQVWYVRQCMQEYMVEYKIMPLVLVPHVSQVVDTGDWESRRQQEGYCMWREFAWRLSSSAVQAYDYDMWCSFMGAMRRVVHEVDDNNNMKMGNKSNNNKSNHNNNLINMADDALTNRRVYLLAFALELGIISRLPRKGHACLVLGDLDEFYCRGDIAAHIREVVIQTPYRRPRRPDGDCKRNNDDC